MLKYLLFEQTVNMVERKINSLHLTLQLLTSMSAVLENLLCCFVIISHFSVLRFSPNLYNAKNFYIFKFTSSFMLHRNQDKTQTKLAELLDQKKKYIRATLSKLGCHLLSEFHFSNNSWYQTSDNRLQLIQWLIALIYPGYKLDSQYRNCYDEDPYILKVKRLSIVLWQLGVLPISKYTKNLDYSRYIEGLLGQESAINLIYDLTELAQSKYSAFPEKVSAIAGDLLWDLIKNKNELVNISYDPYGVLFPSQFYKEEEDEVKLEQLYKELGDIPDFEDDENDEAQEKMLAQLESFKEEMQKRYGKLSQSISRLISKNENIEIENNQQIGALHQSRTLKIERSLCKKFKKFKSLLGSIKQYQLDNSKLSSLKQELIHTIRTINQIKIADE